MSTAFYLRDPVIETHIGTRHGAGDGKTYMSWEQNAELLLSAWPLFQQFGFKIVDEYGDEYTIGELMAQDQVSDK